MTYETSTLPTLAKLGGTHVARRPHLRGPALTLASTVGLAVAFLWTSSVRAQLPPLPMPAPPPTATDRLVGDLAHRVIAGAGTLGKGTTYRIEVSATQGAAGGLPPLLADALAGALLQRGWLADRRPDVRRAAGATPTPSIEPVRYIFDLEVSLRPPRLVAALRLREQPGNVWERMRAPSGAVLVATHAEVPLDAELRVLLGKPLKGASIRRERLRSVAFARGPRANAGPLGPPLDMWVGQVGQQRASSMLLLFRDRLVRYRLGPRGSLIVESTFPLVREPASPAKLRSPLGRIVPIVGADGLPRFLLASSDLAAPVAVRGVERGLARVPLSAPSQIGWPMYAVGIDELVAGPWPLGKDVLTGSAHVVRMDGTGRRQAGPLIPVHDVRGFAHAAGVQPRHRPILVASVAGGGIGLRDRQGAAAIGRHGVGSLVADLDVDGVAELLVTDGAIAPGSDTITIYRLESSQRRRVVRRLRIKGSVSAMAAGDMNGDGRPEYWVAAWSQGKSRIYALGLSK